ncbi:DUF2855 family protein [Pseudomonas sp. LFM046]|uniref:DUF2855 family protein n=1 Tax=Pseudomonas sp. LFM046 TaxID=1608357 RepID=UPI0005CFCDE2|nr:DUF2855 family protein [Pseudomonas sp. LFM046]
MGTTLDLLVKRDRITECRVREGLLKAGDLGQGQALLRVDRFAFTANNITYAALGETLGYWQFFPTGEEGMGIIPVWGFAEVVQSHCPELEIGQRFFGYYPMSTHLRVTPDKVRPNGFVDAAPHRQALPPLYNHYLNCANDALYHEDDEALQMLLRPLFTTSFLLDGFLAAEQFFGAHDVVVTSASSKTAIGMAYLLNRSRKGRGMDYQVIGLTSPGNRAFVEALKCYDRVLGYDELDQLPGNVPSVLVDFAGNGPLLDQVHRKLGSELKYSCLVGAAHWDQRQGRSPDMPGPKPTMFFAPTEAQKLIHKVGNQAFQQAMVDRWRAFAGYAQQWMDLEYGHGPAAVEAIYQQVLQGHAAPRAGHLLSM